MDDFLGFARAHGILIDPGKFYPSSKIQRCPTADKPRSDNGAWWWDGERGWVMDWAGEARPLWFGGKRTWTEQEKAQWARRRAQAAAERHALRQKAIRSSLEDLRAAKPSQHPYLQFKGFPDEQGLVLDEVLLIPMRHYETGSVEGLQRIFWDAEERKYRKKMVYGMKAEGAVFRMGTSSPVWLVEGYATGLSVRAALRAAGLPGSVTVCFSANNLIHVADKIPGERYVFADNDQKSKTGEEAAKATGLPWTMADEEGWDANDLHTKRGLFAVLQKVMTCTKT